MRDVSALYSVVIRAVDKGDTELHECINHQKPQFVRNCPYQLHGQRQIDLLMFNFTQVMLTTSTSGQVNRNLTNQLRIYFQQTLQRYIKQRFHLLMIST